MMVWEDANAAKSSLQSAIMGMLGRVLRNQGDEIDQCAKCNAPIEKRAIEAGCVLVGRYDQGRVRVDTLRVDPDDPTAILPDDYDPKRAGWFYECEHCQHVDGWPWLGARAL